MKTGQIIIVKNGRDKGKPMVVITCSEGHVYLVDGKTRKLCKPKKKKVKHIVRTNTVAILEKADGTALLDADIRKILGNFVKGGNPHCQKTI